MMEACLIARHFPGFGDPWELTIAQWNGVMDRLADILDMENPGDPNDPSTLQRYMQRMKRQKRREKAQHPNG